MLTGLPTCHGPHWIVAALWGVWLLTGAAAGWAEEQPPTPPATAAESPAPPAAEVKSPPPEEPSDNRLELDESFTPRYMLESIEVRGNRKTRGALIISHLLFRPGDLLDEEKVQLSRIRLLALGYFRDVRMQLEKGSARGQVRLVVEVEERNTIIIDDVFFGLSATNPFWLGTGISDINFLGRGMSLSGAVVASEAQQAYRLGLFWPDAFNSRFQIGVQALGIFGTEKALKSRIGACEGCEEPCLSLDAAEQTLPYRRAGGTVSFGTRLDPVHSIAFELHGEHIDADMPAGEECPNHPFRGYIKNGKSTLWSLLVRFERDTRDDFFLPTRGMHLAFSIELASKILFASDYEYSKYQLKYEHSFPAFWDHAFRLSLVGGLIQDVGEKGSPFFNRFFVGDYALFQVNKDSLPRNLELNFSEVFDYGDLLLSIGAEYDVPLWSTGKFFYRGYVYAAFNFSYITKADFLASEDEWSGKPKYPVSVDLGFKVDTPVGLFTLSFGYLADLAF